MSPQDFIESIEIDGKGPLSHVEDGPFEIHPTLSLFKSNIFELKKIYLIYKTLAQLILLAYECCSKSLD
jgi:hypothetical protein